MSIVCEYCNASNPNTEKECVACGAPLVKKTIVSKKPKPAKPTHVEKPDQSVETARKIANVYTSIMLGILDAIIIAAVSFTIGLTGGIINQPVLGVIGAAMLGFAVSITIKNGLLTIISAPVGLLIGSFFCIIAVLFHLPTSIFPIFLTISACFTAIYGGQKVPYRIRSTWLKLRPYLGILGGMGFGLLGMGIGLGVEVVYKNILQFLQ